MYLIIQGIRWLPIILLIAFWIWKKGILPKIEVGTKHKGLTPVIVANVLILLGIGFFTVIALQAKGGGSISGVPLGMWGMLCAIIGVIGVIIIEWNRWKPVNRSGIHVMQLIIVLALAYKPLQYIAAMLIR